MIQFDKAVERHNKLILTELKDAGVTCWIAGGALRSYFTGDKVVDYDLFFPSQIEYDKAKQYFLNNDDNSKKIEVKWESDNGMKIRYNGRTFDLVKKFFTSPQESIQEFDFTVSMLAIDTEKVYHGETTFIDLAKKQLMLNKLPYPASTMKRAFKYYKKGYTMCVGEMRKLAEAIQKMPPIEVKKENDNNVDNDQERSSMNDDAFFGGID